MKYTEEHIAWLREHVKGTLYKDLAEMFNKTFGADITTIAIRQTCRRYGISNGVDGCFKKGHEPHNKGQKMSATVYEKVKHTMFKKGNKPWKTLPIGSELLDGDGYVRVKVNDVPYERRQSNWIPKQRIIYAQHYGEVPADCLVLFADGDRRNFDIDNLILVKKSENVIMNKNGLRFKNAELTKAGHTLAKLMIATREAERGKKK